MTNEVYINEKAPSKNQGLRVRLMLNYILYNFHIYRVYAFTTVFGIV